MEELRSILQCEPTPQPVSPDPRALDNKLRLGYNVTYIVAAVLLQEDKVLLIQEAKPSCRGAWYLPAGRMEANETIVEAVKREVEEESGLTFEPVAVIAMECMSQRWVRITMSGKVSGGSLKTTAQADKESLQAGWFSKQEIATLQLRAPDILPLIECGRGWCGRGYGGLPVQVGHVSSSLRLIVVAHDNQQLVVLTKLQGYAFPTVDISYSNIASQVKACGCHGEYTKRGVLSLEHLGRPNGVYDGMCASVLVEVKSLQLQSSDYQWTPVTPDLQALLEQALESCAQLLFH